MNVYVIVLGGVFAILSTVVLSYISMATMLGPWIAPTLVLLASVVLQLRLKKRSEYEVQGELALIQAIGSVGGALGMAIGFSLPTLYFLDKTRFLSMLSQPWYFCILLAGISLAAGGLGIILARIFSDKLVKKENYPFPVSSLIYSTITSQSQVKEIRKLFWGISCTSLFCIFRAVSKSRF